jgi:DNA-binding response OmpR family regulator
VIRAVIVSAADLSFDLRETLLCRSNVERHGARSFADVRQLAAGGRPDVVVVDSALPGAAAVVAALRQDAATRSVAIVALARSEFSFGQLDLLDAGANAILPLPPGADWDDRLMRLVHAPVRRATRLDVDIAVEGGMRGGLRLSGRALNLSVNGLLLDCQQALEVGDDLRLEFELPGHGPVRASGTVIRLRPPQLCGVEITSVEGDGRVRIKRYVESGAPD